MEKVSIKKCKLCGIEFEASYHTVKYCCKEHAREGKRQMQKNTKHTKCITVTQTNKEIDDISAKAKKLGMSYGQYEGMLYMKGRLKK